LDIAENERMDESMNGWMDGWIHENTTNLLNMNMNMMIIIISYFLPKD